MHILFYFENQINPQKGGTERVADNIAQELKKRGHKISYLSRRKVDGAYNVSCYFLPDQKGNTPLNYSYVKELIAKLSIDIIINEGGNTEDIYLFSKEYFPNITIITHLHFTPLLQYKYFYRSLYLPISLNHPFNTAINILKWIKAPLNKYNLLKYIKQRYKYMYNNSDKVILLAPSYITEFCKLAKVSYPNTKCISIFNPNTFPNTYSTNNKKENIVLFVGRLTYEHKRLDYLLRIWIKVSKRIKDWDLYIVGDGPDKERLIKFSKQSNMTNIHFEGFKDIAPYYKRAKILCLTSITEGSPMVIIEAMQNGVVPIVYNTFSASKYLIESETNGYIIPPFNTTQYANTMIKIMTNKNLYNKMSTACIKSSDKYKIETIVDSWEDLFQSIYNLKEIND